MLDLRSFDHVGLEFPPVELCTDNAAMIGWTGIEMFEAGYRTDLNCEPKRKWSMDSQDADGGILGVDGWTRYGKVLHAGT
jgi:N6-L-threonylcarbamoyladenine synthase